MIKITKQIKVLLQTEGEAGCGDSHLLQQFQLWLKEVYGEVEPERKQEWEKDHSSVTKTDTYILEANFSYPSEIPPLNYKEEPPTL